MEFPSGDSRPLVHGIALATSVATLFCDMTKWAPLDRVNDLGTMLYGMSFDDLVGFLDSVRARVTASADLLKVDASRLGSAADIMDQAQEQLRQLSAMDADVERTLQATDDGGYSPTICPN
jgi:hypothetical protein